MIPEIIQVFNELRDEVPPRGEVCRKRNVDLFMLFLIVTQSDDVVRKNSNLIPIRDNTFCARFSRCVVPLVIICVF